MPPIDFSRFGKDKGKHPLEKEEGNEMARDPTKDPTEELGGPLSPAERVTRVFQQIAGQDIDDSPLTAKDLDFLRNNSNSTYRSFTEKQEKWMQDIERRVFGEQPVKTLQEEGLDELTGELKFKGRGRR